ncbi:nucleoside triphosphate pyrophosphohydrolase [Streptomyces sp. PvR018]|uniref:nucleoside triphosphate pyrophosphohydrolase n=1 Tax=Streptomyces sp. PvR018 TaxID=3156442 RepID=UPI0033983ED3
MPEKLIRDYIPEIAASHGRRLTVRTATPAELPNLLLSKLLEEADEAATAEDGELLEELADVLEVVYALAAHHGHSVEDLERIRAVKAGGRGRFTRHLVMQIPATSHSKESA